MLVKDIEGLIGMVRKMYAANGVCEEQAREVAEILVETTMIGLASHGLFRTRQYIEGLKSGGIVANAPIETTYRNRAVAVVNGNWNFGHLSAKAAAKTAAELAREYGIGCCTVRRTNHIGALSVYTRMIAAGDCIALGFVGTAGMGNFVAPYGGRQGRVATNPISFAAPTYDLPVSSDFSTSMISEGKLKLLRDSGQKIAPIYAMDRNGARITDPNDFYEPAVGALLPLGESQGYKGTALSVMNMILSCLLGGFNWRPDVHDGESGNNTLLLIAIDISYLNETDRFKRELDEYAAYIRSSEPLPGFSEIMFPGDIENYKYRNGVNSGVEIDAVTCGILRELCAEYSIDAGILEEK